MKRFAFHVLVVAVLGGAVFLSGCGGSDTAAIPLTAIDNTSQGAAAASAGMQAQGFATIGAMSALFSPAASDFGISATGKPASLMPPDPRARGAAERIAALSARLKGLDAVSRVYAPLRGGTGGPLVAVSDNGTMTGPGGGYFTWRRSYNSDTGVYSVELAFFDFTDNGAALEIVNGTLSESGKLPLPGTNPATQSAAVRLGTSAAAPLSISKFTDNTLSVLRYRDTFYLVMNIDASLTTYTGGTDNAAETLGVSIPAGTLKEVSGPGGTGDNIVFAYNGFALNLSARGFGDNTSAASVAANGSFQFRFDGVSGDAGISVSYSNMRWTESAKKDVYADGTIDGVTSFAFTPVLSCTDNVTTWTYGGGTYAFATAIPIHLDVVQGHTTAGRFSINGTTVVTFNADGSVTITVNGVPIELLYGPETVCVVDVAT